MTGQVLFDSHVLTLVEVASRLVNALTPGSAGGRPAEVPEGAARVSAVAEALGGDGRRVPAVSPAEADALVRWAGDMRTAFVAAHAGDVAAAARAVNDLLAGTGARPRLDEFPDVGWQVHFHGSDDTLATGWAAGCASGLALALGSDLAGRLGVCEAPRCDRVHVDTSRNGTRRFCSTACQNRTKAAAFRARAQG